MAETIKQYSITGSDNAQDFVNAINSAIKDGWTPIGGVSVAVVAQRGTKGKEPGFKSFWCQAMVKYEALIVTRP